MKTVLMDRDFDYHPSPQVTIWYKAGKRYERVPEAAVATIEAAGAGKATGEMEPAPDVAPVNMRTFGPNEILRKLLLP